MFIVRALYGPESSGTLWRSMLVDTLGKDVLGYTASKAGKDTLI